MSIFQERLARAVSGYRHSSKDGAWGEYRSKDAPASIVNTVEVLAVLKAAQTPYEDVLVKRSLRFLSTAVIDHPVQRGPNVRYCAWGLCGLTMYSQSRHDPTLQSAQVHCVDWLADNQLTQDAWGEQPTDDHPSLLATSAAITGLRRVCPYHEAGEHATELVKQARTVVRALARQGSGKKSQRTTSWTLVPGGGGASPSASATAMAVLSLAGGEGLDREMASEGARWLLRHPQKWRTAVEQDEHTPEANWQHMTFSLALRAILRGAKRPSNDVALRDTLKYLGELWSEEREEWRHGKPNAPRTSPSGSYAVVTAYEAMARAWPFDAQREILGERSQTGSLPPAEVSVNIGRDDLITITDINGGKLTATLPPNLLNMFRILALRHIDGAEKKTLNEWSCDFTRLTKELKVVEETTKRYMRGINKVFKDESHGQDGSIGDIVQVSGHEKPRMLINVDRVTVE